MFTFRGLKTSGVCGLKSMSRMLHATSVSLESATRDSVFISNLSLKAWSGKDAWNRLSAQPISVSVDLRSSITKAGEDDDLQYSLNYAVISRNITNAIEGQNKRFDSLMHVAETVAAVSLDGKNGGGNWVNVNVQSLKSLLRARSLNVSITRERSPIDQQIVDPKNCNLTEIHGIEVMTIIGVFGFERLQKQKVVLDLSIETKDLAVAKKLDLHNVALVVSSFVEGVKFKTVEALATTVTQLICQEFPLDKVTVKVQKPNAIAFANGVGVSVTRMPADFAGVPKLSFSSLPSSEESLFSTDDRQLSPLKGVHDVYIAFGTNEGDPLLNIETALVELDKRNIKVKRSSSLYESEPMYYTNQPKFVNGVVRCVTDLEPLALLDSLQDIESNVLKRVKHVDKGPRTIDLDIILYDDLVFQHPRLTIPHIGLLERSFVLQPLCDIIPPTALHPITAEPFHSHLTQLPEPDPEIQTSAKLLTLVPTKDISSVGENSNLHLSFDTQNKTKPTLIMGILNVTPDSFSDGGKHSTKEKLLESAEQMVANDATVLDIGGCSTRPGSSPPSVEEEIGRILPAIEAIRSSQNKALSNIVISVDTYRSSVAKAALEAGANIVNDISGGKFDPQMFELIAKTGIPIMLGHTRGNPTNMSSKDLVNYNSVEASTAEMTEFGLNGEILPQTSGNYHDTVCRIVGRELADQVEAAMEAGVRRWQIILDPGLGFSKGLKENLSVIKRLDLISNYSRVVYSASCDSEEQNIEYTTLKGLPILLGPSRKRFLGVLTSFPEQTQSSDSNKSADTERTIATAASVVSCVSSGADMVRVHDVLEMRKAVAYADALYRDILP